jgi:hypothetical protein
MTASADPTAGAGQAAAVYARLGAVLGTLGPASDDDRPGPGAVR